MSLIEIFVKLAIVQSQETLDIASEEHMNQQQGAFAAYATGAQFGLELAEEYPQLAQQLLEAMHADNPNANNEWFVNAHQFARYAAAESN